MACLFTRNIIDCGFAVGGIRKIYLTNYEEVSDYNFGASGDNPGLITGIVPNPAYGAITWLEFTSVRREVNIEEQMKYSEAGRGFQQKLEMVYTKMEYMKRDAIEELLPARMIAVVKDYHEKWWLLGENNGLKLASYEATNGPGGDENLYSMVLTGFERRQIREINSTYARNAIEGRPRVTGSQIFGVPVEDWDFTMLQLSQSGIAIF